MGYVLVTMITMLAASPSPQEVRRAVDSELSQPSYQRSIPGVEAGGETFRRFPKKLVPSKAVREAGERIAPRDVSPAARAVASTTLWVVMIATGLVLLVLLGRGFLSPKPHEEQGSTGYVVDDQVVARPLGDAAALAERGLFAQAIHTLLLRTLQELSARTPEPVPPSLTSRDILARVQLPEPARVALSGLIDVVEVTHFGGHVPDEPSYHLCLERFHEFARSYSAGPS